MKHIVVGVTGGIAAFKACQLVSDLSKKYEVQVIMTKNAMNFVHPLTFETLTGKKCLVDTFDRDFTHEVEHIRVAKWADVFVVAPATANVIAKFAHGIADDMLTTSFLACTAPKIIAPAMNTHMYENAVTQENIEKLSRLGMHMVDAASGFLACGDTGKGKMADIDVIEEAIEMELYKEKPLAGKKVLVTAGPTMESMDPVRYITNHSSGKMGYEIAQAARNLGAQVVLVSGKTALKKPYAIRTVDIRSAQDMFEAVTAESDECDYIVMAAAVADYTPAVTADEKMKKKDGELFLELARTKDILKTLGERKPEGQVLCGFAMETQNLLENARKKLEGKNADMIVANNIKVEGAGFAKDTNVATFILKEGMIENPLQTKEELAYVIWDQLLKISAEKGADQ